MRWLLLGALAAVMLMAGCGGGGEGPRLVLTPADYGTTTTVALGETVRLALPDNPSTGYSWHQAWSPETSLALSREYFVSASEVDGAGGTRYYELQAREPGQVVITVQYGRWWGGGEVDDAHTFTLAVTP